MPTTTHGEFDLPRLIATLPRKMFVLLHVIMSVTLEDNQILDMDDFAHWLKDLPALASYAKIQGVCSSFSDTDIDDPSRTYPDFNQIFLFGGRGNILLYYSKFNRKI